MEYLFSLLLFGLNLLGYERPINSVLFFVISIILIFTLFYIVYCKCKDFICTCMVLMLHTWPISWRNIFGGSAEALQITWFYLFGALIALHWIFNVRKYKSVKVNAVILGIYVTLCIIAVYPLLISPSFKEGLKEFFVIYFFIILTFVAFLNHSQMDEKSRKLVIDAFIWSVVITAVFLIIQAFLYLTFNESLFKYSVGNYYGNRMISVSLLMEDTSCSTIMLGCGIFYMLERFDRKEKPLLYVILMIVTVVGLAFTSRRTSIISLVVCLILYVSINYKGVLKKLAMFSFFALVMVVMFFYLMISRPVEDYSQYLYSNGRIGNYISALGVFVTHPLGIGYDNVNLLKMVGDFVPHNTILRWLNMGGIIFTVLMMILLGYFWYTAFRKRLRSDLWVVFYCLFAMNFIPDLLNARFFVIPSMLVLLSASERTETVPMLNTKAAHKKFKELKELK